MLLEIKNVRLSFTNARNETFNILDGVNLGVEAGKITAIVGGNGTGKTTLFNIISGFEDGYSGDVVFDGKSLKRLSPSRISMLGIGRLFQGGQLLGGLTLMENMKLGSGDRTGEAPFLSLIHPKKVREHEEMKERQARHILGSMFGEDSKYLQMTGHDASSFSYGEQRLLSLARLMMAENRLLLLDEPTSGVNPVYIDAIGKMIRRIVEETGVTVLLIEHNMQFVRGIADTCAFLDDGVISMAGPADVVMDDSTVRERYLGL